MTSTTPNLKSTHRRQRTLQKSVTFAGLGVHTGNEVTMRFCPAPEGTGVVFKRMDLSGQPLVPATLPSVCDTMRSTTIGVDKARIHTVEHVLSAVRAFDLDNLFIEISNIEPPIADGSAAAFVKMIEDAGVVEQQATVRVAKLQHPVHWSEGDIHLVALPYDGYRISYTLNYSDSKVLRAQFYSVLVNSETFQREIACCRTFSLYEEVAALMDRGLIKGGSLDNAIVIKGDVVFSKGGLHFPDEPVRHKILDVIGDLSLIGIPFHAHIIAIRAGHTSNHQLAKKIYHAITSES